MVIIPGIHIIKLNFVNAYLIEEPEALTLIDTGIPGCDKKVAAYIKSIGRSMSDIKTILITHSDSDHIGSLASIKKLSGARIFSSAIEAEAIKMGRSSRKTKQKGGQALIRKILMSVIMRIKPVVPDKILKDNDELPIFGGLVAVETPGHTPGHMSYYLKVPKVLFCGDSMNSRDDKLTSSNPVYTSNAEKAAESYKKQADMRPSIVCCGHGEVLKDAEKKFKQG